MSTDNRVIFTDFPQIPGDKPMCETEFWQWLGEQQPDNINRFVDTLKCYLKPHGFDISRHILRVDQMTYHKYVYEHFWWAVWNER